MDKIRSGGQTLVITAAVYEWGTSKILWTDHIYLKHWTTYQFCIQTPDEKKKDVEQFHTISLTVNQIVFSIFDGQNNKRGSQ